MRTVLVLFCTVDVFSPSGKSFELLEVEGLVKVPLLSKWNRHKARLDSNKRIVRGIVKYYALWK